MTVPRRSPRRPEPAAQPEARGAPSTASSLSGGWPSARSAAARCAVCAASDPPSGRPAARRHGLARWRSGACPRRRRGGPAHALAAPAVGIPPPAHAGAAHPAIFSLSWASAASTCRSALCRGEHLRFLQPPGRRARGDRVCTGAVTAFVLRGWSVAAHGPAAVLQTGGTAVAIVGVVEAPRSPRSARSSPASAPAPRRSGVRHPRGTALPISGRAVRAADGISYTAFSVPAVAAGFASTSFGRPDDAVTASSWRARLAALVAQRMLLARRPSERRARARARVSESDRLERAPRELAGLEAARADVRTPGDAVDQDRIFRRLDQAAARGHHRVARLF